MNDDGFTLAEMLVGLLLASIALSALATAGRTVARTEHRISDQARTARQLDRLRGDLGDVIASGGPFKAADLQGVARTLSFACGLRSRCLAAIEGQGREVSIVFAQGSGARRYRLPAITQARFAYVSARGGVATDAWPAGEDRLAALVLMSQDRPVAVFPTAVEQASGCAFDLARADCRTLGP